MKAEDRIKFELGDLVFQIAVLKETIEEQGHQLEELKKLTKAEVRPENG